MVLAFELLDLLHYFLLEGLSAELNMLTELLERRLHVLLCVDDG